MVESLLGGVGDFFFGGGRYADPNAINPQYGVPEADVRQAGINTLANVSALLLAAGQPMSGQQRAQLLAGVGPALGGMQSDIFKASQARLMTAQQRTAMEEARGLADLTSKIKQNPEEIATLIGRPVEFVRNSSPTMIRDIMKTQASRDPLQQRLAQLQVGQAEREAEFQTKLPELLAQDPRYQGPEKAAVREMIINTPALRDEYFKSLTPPARQPATADFQNYQIVSQQALAAGQTPPTFAEYLERIKKAGAQTVSLGGSPLIKGITDNILETSKAAEGAADTIRNLQTARTEFDAGIVSGIQAPVELQFRKVLTALGFNDPRVSATEAFQARMAPVVLELVKGLGAGTSISNADREFAEKAAGGGLTLDNASIARLLDVTERMAREKLQRSNQRVSRGLSRDPDAMKYEDFLVIPEPPPYTPPTARAPGAAAGGAAGAEQPRVRRWNPTTGRLEP
jgi:hypothetical protein